MWNLQLHWRQFKPYFQWNFQSILCLPLHTRVGWFLYVDMLFGKLGVDFGARAEHIQIWLFGVSHYYDHFKIVFPSIGHGIPKYSISPLLNLLTSPWFGQRFWNFPNLTIAPELCPWKNQPSLPIPVRTPFPQCASDLFNGRANQCMIKTLKGRLHRYIWQHYYDYFQHEKSVKFIMHGLKDKLSEFLSLSLVPSIGFKLQTPIIALHVSLSLFIDFAQITSIIFTND